MCWLAALFVVAQLGIGLSFDYLFPGVRFPDLAKVERRLQREVPRPEIAVFGSSHFQAFDAGLADALLVRSLQDASPRTFNAAVPAGDTVVAERLMTTWLGQGYRPRMIVVEVVPESLNWNNTMVTQQVIRLLHWRDAPQAAVALCRNGRILTLFRDRFLPLHLHRYQARKQIGQWLFSVEEPSGIESVSQRTIPETDPAPPPLTPEILAYQKAAPIVAHMVREYAPRGLTADRLEQLLQECRDAQIVVELVVAPVSSGYRAGYTPQMNSLFRQYLEKLQWTYGCDFYDWRERLTDGYFADSNHLNGAGSQIFSRQLTEEVILPAWRNLTQSKPERTPMARLSVQSRPAAGD